MTSRTTKPRRTRLLAALGLASVGLGLACGQALPPAGAGSEDSHLQDLAFDRSATNVALIMGAANGLPGLATDMRNMRAVFEDQALKLGFTAVVEPEVGYDAFLNAVKRQAQAVGERGTLLVWFGGHGAADGSIFLADQRFMTTEPMLNALREARPTPMRRFIFLLDTCFSGQLVDGRIPIITGPGAVSSAGAPAQAVDTWGEALTERWGDARSYAAAPFQQALVMSAANNRESALDLGPEQGSSFTSTFTKTIRDVRTSTQTITVRQFVEKVRQSVSSQFQHTPSWRYFPSNAVGDEPLFDGTPVGGGTSGSLFAALQPASGDQITLWSGVVGLPTATRVSLCRDHGATSCADSADDFPSTRDPRPGSGVIFFRTTAAFTPTPSATYSMRAFDATGRLLKAQRVRLDRK